MKKILFALAAALLLGTAAFGQDSTPKAEQIGVDSAQQRLKEVSVSKFEDAGFWKVAIPLDAGVISSRRIQGNPAEKKQIPDEQTADIKEKDEFVLGVKAEFFQRGNTTIAIEPIRPLAVPGITKTISVWVVGRNNNHKLSVVVQDNFGNDAFLSFGKMNFSGWKQLTVAVPSTLEQRNPHYQNRLGIKIVGFVVEPDMLETIGSYFVYFDDLRVVTDLFSEENRDTDDVPDNW